MNASLLLPSVLASSGGHDYLYGLFFLIVALVIGAATKHFLNKVPLPFTVLLLLIGLAMGGLNRAYGPHGGGHGHGDEGGHAAHAEGLWGKFVDTLSGAITFGGNLDGHLILYVFLPILIFEAGFALDVHTFKKSFMNAFYLAGPGIVTATLMTGLCFWGMIQVFGGSGGALSDWNVEMGAFIWLASFLFGAVVSATDPVAVVALLKELGASKKLGTLIEGESLLNDGTAIVAFVLLIGVVTGAEAFLGAGNFIGNATLGFGQIGAAGGLIGVFLGLVAILWVRKVFNDPLIEITVVLVTSFAVFFICEHFFHVSGVLGLVALGIVMAGVGRTRISPEVEHFMHEFWELAAFIANVVIFIVVGVVIAQKVSPTGMDFLILGLVYLAIHVVRAINMGMFYPLMKKAGYGLPGKDAVVVWWGALRGAIGLALALVVYSESLRLDVNVGSYNFREGDTLEEVAKRFEVSVEDLRKENHLSGDGLKKGDTLLIPGGAGSKYSSDAKAYLRDSNSSKETELDLVVKGGEIASVALSSQMVANLEELGTKGALNMREGLSSGRYEIVFKDVTGKGAIAQATLVGISSRVREQFLFLISGIVLLTLLVNATTVKPLVNALGLTKLPAVKKLMFSNASGNVAKGCENEMELLKGDRFLGGANWSLVRKYLPEPTAYPLTSDELGEIDALSEARRRLLEKEKSNYWAQFREGLLGARAVAALDNNLSEFLDLQGKVPLTERDYLGKICGVSKLQEALKDAPVVKGFFYDRLSIAYDAAKAFVASQQEVAKIVDSLVKDLDESGDANKIASTIKLLKDEIRQNRLHGLELVRNLQEEYPEVTVGIETKDAIRSVLNHERNTVKKMRREGTLEADEADRLVTAVEERMKEIMDSPLELRMPEPHEILREVTWVKGLSDSVIEQIVAASEPRSYNKGDRIMEQGGEGDGMIVITRGSVKVSIGDVVVDIMGRGAVIGEMSVLAGVSRTANVMADTSVTALWITTEAMQGIMKESAELAGSLWKTAAMRFAENLIGLREPYSTWSQMQLRRWLNDGEVLSPKDGETLDLYGKTAILVAGQASPAAGGDATNAPAILEMAEARFQTSAKVFVRES